MPRGEPDQEPLLDPEVVRTVLREALASGGRVAEVFAESRGSTAIRLDDGSVEEVVSGRDRGAGVRVLHGSSQAYAHTDRLDAAALAEAARAASGAARDGDGGGGGPLPPLAGGALGLPPPG